MRLEAKTRGGCVAMNEAAAVRVVARHDPVGDGGRGGRTRVAFGFAPKEKKDKFSAERSEVESLKRELDKYADEMDSREEAMKRESSAVKEEQVSLKKSVALVVAVVIVSVVGIVVYLFTNLDAIAKRQIESYGSSLTGSHKSFVGRSAPVPRLEITGREADSIPRSKPAATVQSSTSSIGIGDFPNPASAMSGRNALFTARMRPSRFTWTWICAP